MPIKIYEHKTQYYETDQMGVIHHSNYIRWFEEARTDLMEQIGIGYDVMESQGIMSPVLEVCSEYKSMTRYGETVCIYVKIQSYNGIRMHVAYEIKDKKTGEIRCTGESKHCFLSQDGKLISVKQKKPEFHEIFTQYLLQQENKYGNGTNT